MLQDSHFVYSLVLNLYKKYCICACVIWSSLEYGRRILTVSLSSRCRWRRALNTIHLISLCNAKQSLEPSLITVSTRSLGSICIDHPRININFVSFFRSLINISINRLKLLLSNRYELTRILMVVSHFIIFGNHRIFENTDLILHKCIYAIREELAIETKQHAKVNDELESIDNGKLTIL